MERVYVRRREYVNGHTIILPIHTMIGKRKVSHRQTYLGVSGLQNSKPHKKGHCRLERDVLPACHSSQTSV